VCKYLKRAEAAGLTWPLPEGWDDARVEAALFPRSGLPATERAPVRSKPDFVSTHEQLRQHRHLTLQLLWEEYRQMPTVRCILATDDEAYTYNKRVNRLSTIEEHRMILKAIEHGVTEQRIASVLNVNIGAIRKKRDLLDGICSETAEILKDKHVTADAFKVLRRMKPTRQFEAAELMIAAKNYSVPFAKALLAGTPISLLAEPERQPPKLGVTAEQKAMIEREINVLLRGLKNVEDTYGADILNFSLACRYVERILSNDRIHRYLGKQQPELLFELTELLREVGTERTGISRRIVEGGPTS
jgi:hypothetical protein